SNGPRRRAARSTACCSAYSSITFCAASRHGRAGCRRTSPGCARSPRLRWAGQRTTRMNTRRRKPAPVPHLRPAAARRRRSGLGAARRQRWARALGARWPLIRRWLLGAFLLLVAVLIVIQAREVEWDQVLHAMAS